jgi:hypothetical protein
MTPSFVLASLRGSTLSKSFSEVGSAVGAFPFAKTHCKGERHTRSAVYTSSPVHSLRPRLGSGASREIDCKAIGGRVGDIDDGAGRVRRPTILTIL